MVNSVYYSAHKVKRKRQIPESELATLLNASLVDGLSQTVECIVSFTPKQLNIIALNLSHYVQH